MLKTDYKDDIFDGSRKYRLITNSDGTVSLLDVTAYTQEGDAIGAADLNGIGTEVNQHRADIVDMKTTLAGKSDNGHTHDDRYFTETEVTNKLAGKSDNGHTHDDRYFTEAEVAQKLATKSDTSHSHAWGAITGKPGTFPPSDHNHDSRYYTEAEINSQMAGKAAASHTHPAGQVTAGTLPAGVLATNGTDYGTSRLRNIRYGTAVPASLANGELFFVYE